MKQTQKKFYLSPLPPHSYALLPALKACAVVLIAALPLVLSGCAGMADAASKMGGLGVVTQDVSTFDNSTIVEVSPNWLYDPNGSWGNGVKLGARWSSKFPELVALVLSYKSNVTSANPAYIGLRGIDVNIDGSIQSFTTGKPTDLDSSAYNTVTRTIYTESENTVVVPYSLLEKMLAAKDCRLRVHTSKGHEDAIFSVERIPGGSGTAILSFREFVAKVNSAKASN